MKDKINTNNMRIVGEVEGGYKVVIDGKYVITDAYENILTDRKYDRIFLYREGIACVEYDNKFGFIDTNGAEVIPCIYDKVILEGKEHCLVCKDDKWGFLDEKKRIHFDMKYTLDEIMDMKCPGELDVIG